MIENEIAGYDGSQAQEILYLAGAARRRLDYFSRADLVRAAAELDVPEEAIIQAEQLVRERQSELDDRAEFKRAQVRELRRAGYIGIPLIALFIFGHAFTFVGNFFSIGKSFLKPLGAIFFSKSTQSELEFHEWRGKRSDRVQFGAFKVNNKLSNFVHDGVKGAFSYRLGQDSSSRPDPKAETIERLMQGGMSRRAAETIVLGKSSIPIEPASQNVEH